MPGKSSHVKNEKQYEALKDKGMSKERAARIANSRDASQSRREVLGLRRQLLAGRNDRPEEGSRPQRRQGDGPQELTLYRAAYSETPEVDQVAAVS